MLTGGYGLKVWGDVALIRVAQLCEALKIVLLPPQFQTN